MYNYYATKEKKLSKVQMWPWDSRDVVVSMMFCMSCLLTWVNGDCTIGYRQVKSEVMSIDTILSQSNLRILVSKIQGVLQLMLSLGADVANHGQNIFGVLFVVCSPAHLRSPCCPARLVNVENLTPGAPSLNRWPDGNCR